MEKRNFKPFGKISSLTLGGGGLGQVWGETTREEAVATVNLALESGITHFDVAPMYGKGEAERVLGEALDGKSLKDIYVTTKCQLGTLPNEQVYDHLNESLNKSLENMKLEKVNLFLLHSQLIEDGYELFNFNEFRTKNSTTTNSYFDAVIPAFEKLKQEGKIDHWGIGGLGQKEAIIKSINAEKPPEAVQCAVNILNSAGAIGYVSEDFNPNEILKECQKNDIPILAIRAVQAGALTSAMDRQPHESGFDHKDFEDYEKAYIFRELVNEWQELPAKIAHRYALSIEKVSSVILGVKNRQELTECIEAEQEGVLTSKEMETLEDLFDL